MSLKTFQQPIILSNGQIERFAFFCSQLHPQSSRTRSFLVHHISLSDKNATEISLIGNIS
ncbi:hypothetical protein LX77_02862 [Gelidibacter algens]|uniref:Uncharacterized protein n=1 Tax=Gelidibacter algens TaxID=49280 RepID=A0A327RXW9_9FLAO|nr:hypothetical protein LX77_02862 [Gelidibacter algens]